MLPPYIPSENQSTALFCRIPLVRQHTIHEGEYKTEEVEVVDGLEHVENENNPADDKPKCTDNNN